MSFCDTQIKEKVDTWDEENRKNFFSLVLLDQRIESKPKLQ